MEAAVQAFEAFKEEMDYCVNNQTFCVNLAYPLDQLQLMSQNLKSLYYMTSLQLFQQPPYPLVIISRSWMLIF